MELTQRIKQRLREAQDWTAVIDELEAAADAVNDPTARSQHLYELARACEDVFLDKARAMQCYQKAFKLDQTNVEALSHARMIYQQMAHLEMVSRLMGLELKANRDPSRAAELNYAYGRTMLHLRDLDQARAFLEAATTAAPDNLEYRNRLQEAQYDRASWQQALAGLLQQISAQTGSDDPLGADVAGRGPEISAIYLRAARILQVEAADDARLLPLLFKALDANPTNDEAGFLAETLLAQAGQLPHIQKLQERRVSLAPDDAVRVRMLRDFADVWQVRLNDPDRAAQFYLKALELAFANPEAARRSGREWHFAAFRALRQFAARQGDGSSLLPLAERGLTMLADEDDAVLMALEAGELAWHQVNDLDAARRFFGRAVGSAPSHPYVEAFRRDVGAIEPTTPVATPAAEAAVEAAAEPEAAPAAQAAAPAAEPAGPMPTVEIGDEVFTEDESKVLAAAEAADKAGGKKALDAWREAVQRMPSKRYPREKLKAIYVSQQKWSNVADLLKEALKYIDDADVATKEQAYWELTDIYQDQLKQPGLVVTTLAALEKLLEGAGDATRLLKVVEAQQIQFDRMKRWPDLIGRIRRRAELTEDSSEKTKLHLEAGNLFLEKFNNQAEAIKSYESVLEADEYNAEAIAKLKDLYGRRRDWEKMLAVQQKELGLISDAEERKVQLLEVARTAATKVKKPVLSIQLWSQLLELDPGNGEALEQLEQLYEREKDWPALAGVLQRLVDVGGEPAQRAQNLVKLGRLYADKLEDATAAISAWEKLVEIDPENRQAQDALKKLYIASGDLDRLQSLYSRQEKWAEFVRVLEREAETAGDSQRTGLLLKVAELYADKLEKPDRAMRALEKALEGDANNLEVADRLVALYEGAGEERNLAQPLRIQLAHSRDREHRLALLHRLADVAERVQRDAPAAFEFARQALAEDHGNVQARDALVKLAEATGKWPELVASFEAAIERHGRDREGLQLRLSVAEAHEKRLADLDAALRANQAILEIDAEHAGAIAALERLYLALGREQDLLQILETKLSIAGGDEERRAIQVRIGGIHEHMGNDDKAIGAYEAVLAGSEDGSVLSALDRIYERTGRYADLRDVLRRQLALAPSGDTSGRTQLLLRLAAIHQDRLQEPHEAIELLREALELDRESSSARTRLEALLEVPELRSEVASILLPVYEVAEAWPQLVRCLEIQAGSTSESTERVALLLRAGAILAQAIGDSSRAFDAYARAFREDPENGTAPEALESIAAVENRWADFAALYEEALTKDLPGSLVQRLLGKLATLYDTQLGQSDKAVQCYQRAVDVDPDNLHALDALERLHQRQENWSELLEVYRRKVGLTGDAAARQTLRFQIAYLQEELLGLPTDAIDTYNEILADDETDKKAIAALDRLYQTKGSFAELAENLARQLLLADDAAEEIRLNLRLGDLRTNKLDQPSLAVETYRRVLELDPQNATAIDALERLLGHPDLQVGVARILEPIFRARNDWAKLIRTYEILVQHSLNPSEKIALLHQIGELYEIAGDEPSKAFAAFGRALAEDPANEQTQTRLDNLARQLNAYPELVALYEKVVENVVDDALRIQMLLKVATIHERALGDAVKAGSTYEKILAVDPNNFHAVDALIEVHRQTNNFDALVAGVVRKSEMVDAPGDRKQLLLYAANVRDAVMSDADGAVTLYQQVLQIDDSDRTALEALERLYIQLERWEQLKDVYQRKTELAEDPDERRKTLYVLGQVYDTELKDVERAIDTYQAILDIDPGDYQAISALDRLYGQAERWLDQLQILERAVDAVERPEERASIRHRIGLLWEKELADGQRAVEAYREVLAHDPHHQPTLAALERLARGDTEPMLAAQVLEPLYEQLAEWGKLVEIYEILVKHAQDPIGQIERLHQIAGIHERHLNDFDRASDAYARAIAIDPQQERGLRQLARLAEVTGDWEKFTTLLAAQAERLVDPAVKVQLLLTLARTYEERLQDPERAVRFYNEILQADPDNLAGIVALDRIFHGSERWPDLVENLRRQIRVTEDEATVVDLYFRMGQIYQHSMGDLSKAIESYREVLNLTPDHGPTLEALEQMFSEGQQAAEIAQILEPIYYASERWEALVKLAEAKLAATEETSERLQIIQNVSEICERRLADPSQTFIWWLRAYMDDPANEHVVEELTRLAEITQDWAYIVDVGAQILEDNPSPQVRKAVLLRSADVLEHRLQDTARAIDAYRQVLQVEDDNADALAALDRLYSQAGMVQDLAEILQRRIRSSNDPELLVGLELRLARTLEDALANPDQAILAYNRVLDNDPRNQEALARREALFLSQYRWQDLYENYQRMADVANTDEDMAGCYQRMAKIASDALGREQEAIDLWNRVLDLRGEDPIALGELAQLHQRNQRWDELVEILERQVFVLEIPEQRVAAYQTLGRVYGEQLGRERNALDAWLNALELDGDNLETLWALHRIYEQSQAWVELGDILERQAVQGAERIGAEHLRDVYAKMGRIQGEFLMQSDQAIDAWHKVLELDAGDMEALAALEALYTREARWNEAITVLESKSRVLGDTDARVDVLMQIASIWEEKLQDRTQAAGAYLELLELVPGHAPASDALEKVYDETGDFAALCDLLINRAGLSDDPEEKVSVLQRAARYYEEQVGDDDAAFAVLQAAFNVDYANDLTARELERLATKAGKWGDLLQEYNGMVEQIPDPIERSELWVKIGRWYAEHLDRPDYGIQALERALELNGSSVSALRELANFHRRSANAEALAHTLARIVPLETEPAEQAATLLELARVQDMDLVQSTAAVDSYRRVLEIDADSAEALDALARLHEQAGQWYELVQVLGRRAAISEDRDHALMLKKRVGAVQETALGDSAGAIETYRDIIGQEPTDREALAALERLYRGNNQVQDYLEILEAELDATVDVAEQVGIYEKMAAALIEFSNDRERAAEVLEKIVMLDTTSERTYIQLEELYAGLERWTELVETYRSHVEATSDPTEKTRLLAAMGLVYEKKVEDVDRAIETYREILTIDPESFEAALTLSRLQEQIEDWEGAIDTMGRLADLTRDPSHRMDLLTRMGRVLHEKVSNTAQAEVRLNQALEMDPGHVPALRLLAEIYKSRGDWIKAARTLETASNASNNLLEKTTLLSEAAFIHHQELDERAKAIELFRRTLDLDPEHVRVGKILAELYYQDGNQVGADPIYDVLTRKVDSLELDDDEQRDLFLRGARVARDLGDGEKALRHYQKAYDIDSTNHDVLVGMADLLFEREDWERAFKLYQTILVQHRDTQSDEETVRVYHRLGLIKQRQDQPRKALNYFEKALEVDPRHRETLAAVMDLQAGANDWEGVIQAKRALIDVSPDGDEQFALYTDIGRLYAEKIGNKDKASEAYTKALELKPTDYPSLHTLLDLYTTSKRWEEAVRAIDRIVEIETEALRRSRYNYTAAVLLRDELNAHDESIDRFNMVLDDDPTMLKAFQAIDTMVTKSKDWKGLERAYRKMLKRLGAEGNDGLRLTLWSNLGEIYRSRMKDYKSAAAAFEVAAKLDPENIDRHQILAELYERLLEQSPTEFVAEAVKEHQTLIAHEPFRYESYHALFNIYRGAGEVDKSFCVAAVLAFLKKATNDENAVFERHYKPDYQMARQRLSETTLRRHVFHPDEDLYLTAVLGMIAPAVAHWRGVDLPASLKPKERVDISSDPALFSRIAKFVKDVLNVAQPDVFLRPTESGDLSLINVKRDDNVHPTMIVFQNLLRGKAEKHLAFALGRYMMDMYLPHYCYVALDRSPQALKQVFMACLKAVGMPVQGEAAALDQIAREILGRMPAGSLDQLKTLIKKFVEAGGSTDVKKWAAAAELTAYRVGFLLCGDIVAAAQMVSQEQAALGSAMSPKDKIKELVLYGISEDYFAARKALGLNVA